MKTLIIIPAYNEEESILKTINVLKESLQQHPEYNVDYIVINDGSKDNTSKILEENQIPHINQLVNMGVGAAIQTGIVYAQKLNYDYVMQYDADGQHRPENIFALIDKAQEGNDIVIGSRFLTKSKPFTLRMLGSRILSTLIRIRSLGKLKITDPTSGQRIINRKVMKAYSDDACCSEPNFAIKYFEQGYSVCEIQVDMNEREAGESHFNFLNSTKFMLEQSLAILLGF